MPKYINETDAPITPIGGHQVDPGVVDRPRHYYRDARGLTLLAHNPSPIRTLHADTVGESGVALTGLELFAEVEIKNETGAAITIIINKDSTTDPYEMFSGEIKVFDQDMDVSTMDIAGEGIGKLYVYGMM
jgi:hypothetical protein